MTNSQLLAWKADEYLAKCSQDPGSPFYLELPFERRMNWRKRKEALLPVAPKRLCSDHLLRREWNGIIREAGLTPCQNDVLRRRLGGLTLEEIAQERECSKQCVQRVFIQSIKKIRRAYRVYRYVGLSEVYRLETKRGLPKPSTGKLKGLA